MENVSIVGYLAALSATVWVAFRILWWVHGATLVPPKHDNRVGLYDFVSVVLSVLYLGSFVTAVQPSGFLCLLVFAAVALAVEGGFWAARGTGQTFHGYGG